jgi:hypothetical protein
MHRLGRDDKQCVDLGPGQQVTYVSEATKLRMLRLQGSNFLLDWITCSDQVNPWEAGQHRRVQLSKAPQPGETDAHTL